MTATLLTRPTLVLNRHWQPIHVASVKRALVMLVGGAARAVDPESYQLYGWEEWRGMAPRSEQEVVRSASACLRAPEVVVLAAFDRLPNATVAFSKRNVFRRDRYTCQYCGKQPGIGEVTLDHVVPRSQGGETNWTNCVLACLQCNRDKADRTPEQAHMRLRRRPERPTWKPLYAIASAQLESWSLFLGAKESGLATVT